ncbi:hypothetical protein BIY27_22325 [Gibbsiella quercinecans]|uniref:DcrB-related protein n=1 Tax=Gibbsiella quercinecans TaxID=929813 RepID=UPI000EF220F8|nr:DcrB-related protein [Gibbsiella quercinecans]RLM04476.1 hypothetical protein BIY27_22325 [Gibbsiella quercinecans]
MTQYFLQEGSLEIPEFFKDRTMNLFTLSENSASEFTFVVSRASASKDDKVQTIAARLVTELENTLQDFSLKYSKITAIDGQQAIEIFYHFNNTESLIWQKQTIVLLDEGFNGKKIVCYIGTCPNNFGDYYQRHYQSIIDSIKFRKEDNDNYIPTMVPADSEDTYFAVDKDSKCLFVFSNLNTLYQNIDLTRALNDSYMFFDCKGSPLHIAPVNQTVPLRYALWTTAPHQAQELDAILPLCRSINGLDYMSDIETISTFIQSNRNR